MSNEQIRKHLRAALNEIIAKERQKAEKSYEDADKIVLESKQKMKPLLDTLNVLKIEVGDIEGLEIKIAEQGHMARVISEFRNNPGLTKDSLTISTNEYNTAFLVEQRHYDSYFSIWDEEKKNGTITKKKAAV